MRKSYYAEALAAHLAQPVLATVRWNGHNYEARPNQRFCSFCDLRDADGCRCGSFEQRDAFGLGCENPEFYPEDTVAWTRVIGPPVVQQPVAEPNPL